MKILLVHQNFPGQFKHIYAVLAADPAYQVVVFTMNQFSAGDQADRVRVIQYQPGRGNSKDAHPWLRDIETKTIRAEAAFKAAMKLKEEGFVPDVIVGHPGWGECLCLKEVWPNTKALLYAEFYYQTKGGDVGFDPEFGIPTEEGLCRTRFKNINGLLNLEIADACISPTEWQKSTYPTAYQPKIHVIHDGIDTDHVKPDPTIKLKLDGIEISKNDEIITFVNRNLEPYRGYHHFMRALPKIMSARPQARVIIVGEDGISYGSPPPAGKTWKEIYLNEVRDHLDMSRVHFVGKVNYPVFLALLSCSTVHVYLTYPFVLSWSLLEAMACECAIVASDTSPLREAIIDGKTGKLVDFFNEAQLARSVIELLQDPKRRMQLGEAARQHVITHYDLKRVCLPELVKLIHTLGHQPQV
jgi:glycosyltransferase involved in cell wall biosynthesis